jgi:RNA polymerase sigma factor (sigma-70 family)
VGVNEAYRAEVAPSAGRADVEELSRLYHEAYHRFVRVAEAITGDVEEARDAVQDGFSHALRELECFRGRGSFEGWVWRCVVNAARMARRKSTLRHARPLVLPVVETSEATGPESRLMEQISRLPERQRLALFLRYFADLSYDGIAEAVDVSPGTVAATLNAAHRALRRRLEEVEDEH